jgi:glucose-1-phosphate cytidylyltransferase
MAKNQMEVHHKNAEPWRVTVVDTGEETMTGGRLKRVRDYLGDSSFCFTYGDGVCDVNIRNLIEFHKSHGREATVTAVQPPGRYGALRISDGGMVQEFQEKPIGDGSWINGGFFVLEPKAVERVADDGIFWEREPMESLAKDGELAAFRHEGFWRPMDTLRDKVHLEELWASGQAPWKVW